MRDYQIDLMGPYKDKRLDIYIGIRAGWIFPVFRQTPDEFYYNLRNFDADKFDSYTVANALISYETNGWTATLAARNLGDERPGVQGFDLATLCGCNEVAYRAPRYYSVSVRKDF